MGSSYYASYGSLEIDKLYEPPFTGIDSDGVDGVFPNDKDVDDFIDIIEIFTASAKKPVGACLQATDGQCGWCWSPAGRLLRKTNKQFKGT